MANGILNAWIDFRADGSRAQAGDQIANNLVLPLAGPNVVNFNVPANAATGSNVFARFRFSTALNLSYTNTPGQVPNGEVEDYRWLINQLDFGDAPAPYPTLLANNGARHAIVPGFCLGILEDGETNGLPSPLATGDDTNSLADEDGVVFVTPLVIGTQACVNVTLTGTNGGKLDAWIDFNTNGTWESTEQVFANKLLTNGVNSNLCFSVPAAAPLGPAFARFRLSSAGGLSPTGQAADGEVEDYLVTVVQRRPSTNIVFTSKFNGWNEPSMAGSTTAADDWVCTSTNPVTDIRWWGSFLNWRSNMPPQLPDGFEIRFWTDVKAGAGMSFSHPGQLLSYIFCTNYTWQFVGWDLDPKTLDYEACFRFEQRLAADQWFHQTNSPTGTNICWVGIAAVYSQGTPQHDWGWKTRPRDTNSPAPDDAVRFYSSQGLYEPIYWPDATNSWDMAFELISSYTNVVDKWEQLPDLSTAGIDVNDTRCTLTNPPPPQSPYLLADDFQCHSTGPLTEITIWGSWTNDWEPNPTNLSFTLSIHKDVPAQGGTNSMPGQLLWKQTFGPGQYRMQILPVAVTEGWLTPPTTYFFPADHACFQYDFHVATNAFVQTNGTIYWLDVQAQLDVAGPKFGWKTSLQHWNDDAVWVSTNEPYGGNLWKDLHYPQGHQFYPASIDLAFRVANSQGFIQLKWSQPPVTNRYEAIEWNSESLVHYQLQATTTLSNAPACVWTNVGPEVIGPVHEQSDTNISSQERYYRIIAPHVVP